METLKAKQYLKDEMRQNDSIFIDTAYTNGIEGSKDYYTPSFTRHIFHTDNSGRSLYSINRDNFRLKMLYSPNFKKVLVNEGIEYDAIVVVERHLHYLSDIDHDLWTDYIAKNTLGDNNIDLARKIVNKILDSSINKPFVLRTMKIIPLAEVDKHDSVYVSNLDMVFTKRASIDVVHPGSISVSRSKTATEPLTATTNIIEIDIVDNTSESERPHYILFNNESVKIYSRRSNDTPSGVTCYLQKPNSDKNILYKDDVSNLKIHGIYPNSDEAISSGDIKGLTEKIKLLSAREQAVTDMELKLNELEITKLKLEKADNELRVAREQLRIKEKELDDTVRKLAYAEVKDKLDVETKAIGRDTAVLTLEAKKEDRVLTKELEIISAADKASERRHKERMRDVDLSIGAMKVYDKADERVHKEHMRGTELVMNDYKLADTREDRTHKSYMRNLDITAKREDMVHSSSMKRLEIEDYNLKAEATLIGIIESNRVNSYISDNKRRMVEAAVSQGYDDNRTKRSSNQLSNVGNIMAFSKKYLS